MNNEANTSNNKTNNKLKTAMNLKLNATHMQFSFSPFFPSSFAIFFSVINEEKIRKKWKTCQWTWAGKKYYKMRKKNKL